MIFKTVLYLRLSDEDKNKLSKEELSQSIKNQEIMLRDYAIKHDFKVIGIYSDDDWSGSDDTRPNFNKMIEECKKGNVDVVLCKTQARFARDMELIEKYVHNLFHQWNVRFITVVDRIDNAKRETKKTSQILGLTDEWYLEDTSLNIRETLKAKRKDGQLTSSFAVYGYMKDPQNKNHLIIDPISSLIVKRIYDEYLFGYGLDKIAKKLNEDKILSPYEYKLFNGSKLKLPIIKDYINYGYIDKAGTYILDISFTNKEECILNDLVSFNYITADKITFNSKCDIVFKKCINNKTKIYYSEKDNIDIDNFNIDDFILLNENDCLSKKAKVIAAYTEVLDRTHSINYQFEITIKENREHINYYINIYSNKTKMKKSNFIYNIRKKFIWSSSTIRKLLSDEVYIGNLVQFKSTTVSYKNHTVVQNDINTRIRKDNTHEAIINKDIWYMVKERLKNNTRSCKGGTVYPLCNKVYCFNCNQKFIKTSSRKPNGSGYLCCKDKKTNWSNCDNKTSISEDIIYQIILEKVSEILNNFYEENYLKEMQNKVIGQELYKDKLSLLEMELQNINKKLQSKNIYFQKLYEDYVNGILREKEFLILMNKYKDDSEKLEELQKIIKEEIMIILEKKEITQNNIFKKYRHIKELSVELVQYFIDKIYVGNYCEKENARDIKIVWDFNV